MEKKVYRFEKARVEKFNYLLHVPKDSEAARGLIIFLHGAGERGDDYGKISVHGIPKYILGGLEVGATVVAPQCPDGTLWSQLTFELREFIEFIINEQGIDRSRVSISGISMGGYGTWEMITSYPELFAAAAPVCGGGVVWRACLAKPVPVRAFHGESDATVPLFNSVQMCDALNKNGGQAELTIYHGVGHDSWCRAYETTDVISWLARARKA